MSRSALLLILLAGCAGDEAIFPAYIAPVDGQTAVPRDLSLRVQTGPIHELPPAYEVPDLIRVVDLTDGGYVPGRVDVDTDSVRFTPRVRWRSGHRYVWTFDPAKAVPHGPEFGFPDTLEGSAVFDVTADRLDLLDATLDAAGRTCLVFSRRLTADDDGPFAVYADGDLQEGTLRELLPVDTTYALEPLDAGIDTVCLTTPEPLLGDTELTIEWGQHGPWRVTLRDTDLTQIYSELRRATP